MTLALSCAEYAADFSLDTIYNLKCVNLKLGYLIFSGIDILQPINCGLLASHFIKKPVQLGLYWIIYLAW